MTGLPLILTSKFIINDIFGPSLGDSTVAIAAAFPALLSTGNLVGRLLWGTLSDRIGCASTLAFFGLSVPALMMAPLATTMVAEGRHDLMRWAISGQGRLTSYLTPNLDRDTGRREPTRRDQRLPRGNGHRCHVLRRSPRDACPGGGKDLRCTAHGGDLQPTLDCDPSRQHARHHSALKGP